MKIVSVRIDDACPRMKRDLFYRMVSLVEDAGIKGMIGVVPCCEDEKLNQEKRTDPRFWERMKELQNRGWVLAQHGFTHVYDIQGNNLVSLGRKSEFAGHTYEEQLSRIIKGKELLETHGIYTDCFFAPSHAYDRNTLRALQEAGFHYVSDGCSRSCYTWYGLKMIPCRIRGIPANRHRGVLTVVTHPCAMSEQGWNALTRYMNENQSFLTDYKDFLQLPADFSAMKRMEEHMNVFFNRHIKPWLFPPLRTIREAARRFLK